MGEGDRNRGRGTEREHEEEVSCGEEVAGRMESSGRRPRTCVAESATNGRGEHGQRRPPTIRAIGRRRRRRRIPACPFHRRAFEMAGLSLLYYRCLMCCPRGAACRRGGCLSTLMVARFLNLVFYRKGRGELTLFSPLSFLPFLGWAPS